MHSVESRTIEPRVLYVGTPVVLVSTLNPDGSSNLAPMSSAWWVDRVCMLGLDATSKTTINLRQHRELVLNLPDSAMASAVDRLACTTGTEQVPEHKQAKGYRYVHDKFAQASLTPQASDIVQPARAAECPIQMEAVVDHVRPLGGRRSGVVSVEAHVVRTHVHGNIVVAGSDRHIDPERWDPLIMKFCHLYGRATNVSPSRLADAWEIPPVYARSQCHETHSNRSLT